MIVNNKECKIGTLISLDLPQITSLIFKMGFDFVFIDLEHNNVSDSTITSIISAKAADSKVLIRITEISETAIRHALDLGCDGIVAPRVESMEEIKELADYSFYPPLGRRSVGFGNANKYGLNFNGYISDFKPLIFPQIESRIGVELAASILAHPQVSGTFIGPYDLSLSLGIPGDFDNALFTGAVETVRSLCARYNKSFGTFTAGARGAAEEMKKGTDWIIAGADANLLLSSYQRIIDSVKDA